MTEESADRDTSSQRFWVYKKGALVLVFTSTPGAFLPTGGAGRSGDVAGSPEDVACAFASGQFMSLEWEPRIRLILQDADDLVEFIEILEDRKYDVDIEPPSRKSRPFRHL